MDIVLNPILMGAIPVVLGVIQVIKKVGMPSKYAPLLSVFLGLVLAFFLGSDATTFNTILQGLILGLSASGLYSGSKATFVTPTI